jgi:hypothetical protein
VAVKPTPMGGLTIDVSPECEIFIDNASYGSHRHVGPISLPLGSHRLRFRNKTYSILEPETVVLETDQHLARDFSKQAHRDPNAPMDPYR